ncbi:hypothetical protein HPC49_11330 [Pyxidicoccus fallax]|uniref:Lipoprotein n=1 Tax=Pyxidicoccus fallax TaxID=394095 RepID=A0A848LHA4_9BACT|nr:hypothetical protein [Pyxidicoccus fallax]NMO17105.1 hypothetical protein [Pyxidicoccus fallax]NPC78830.1 hypothetical protein [Pyxidicoccus fallax]
MSSSRFLAFAVLLASGPSVAVEPPWGEGKNLGQRMTLERTAVCTDGRGHYVTATSIPGRGQVQVFYGDGKRFTQVPLAPNHFYIPPGAFLDPRFSNPEANSNVNNSGLDLRPYSYVKADLKANTCAVTCGTRTTSLTLVEPGKARDLLLKATYGVSPQKFEPHALLRDTKGQYYLVERNTAASGQKGYRIFIGPRGRLKPQQMLNVVADSKGEIFSTKQGDLQLVLDREQPSLWIVRKRRMELRSVPVEQNLQLIYNELGVYTGARLGTPCDDL